MAKMTANVHKAVRAFLAEAGRKGGLAKSAAKTAANRANAKQPRPNARGKRKAA